MIDKYLHQIKNCRTDQALRACLQQLFDEAYNEGATILKQDDEEL